MPWHSFRIVLLAVVFLVGGCGGVGESSDDDGDTASGPVDGYTSEPASIYVDGEGEDWEPLPVRHSDVDDGGAVGIERLWAAHSERHLFLRLELSEAVNLQEDNGLRLYLDTDNDPGTGEEALGLGAELTWAFGDRAGRFEGTEITHADIGLASLPTVQSDVFELALDRSATPDGSASLFQGDSLRIALSNAGDRLPDEDGGVGYVLTDDERDLEAPSIERPSASAVRLLSYNSANDFDRGQSAIFMEDRQPRFRRIFDATGPDVIAFQEIYSQTADETETVAEGALGISDEWEWAKRGQDLVLGSRFPIRDTHTIPGYDDYESGAFLLDAGSALGSDLVVVVMHPPCCNYEADEDDPSRNVQRQRVVDGVAAFMRDVKEGKGPFGVEPETPVALLGDMNFVGDAQQPRTLRTGEIVNEGDFGPGAPPDWDGSSLLDTNPRQVHSPMHMTWINDQSSFPPGRLDYAFVTDSVLDVVHEFVLYTPVLSDEERSRYGLEAEDTDEASDHLPVVIDVTPR